MESRLRRRWILNIGLALLAAGLLLVMWWRPGQTPPPPPLTALKTADIRHVVINQAQQPAIELVREAIVQRRLAGFVAEFKRLRAAT